MKICHAAWAFSGALFPLLAFAGSQDADEHYYTLPSQERAKHGAPFVDPTIYASWNALAA